MCLYKQLRNAKEYDAMACAAAEGHDNILQYLLSLGQSPNGTCKVIILNIHGSYNNVQLFVQGHMVSHNAV